MAEVIIYSQYTNNVGHVLNYLTYAGSKLESQSLVMSDGSRIAVDPEEQIDWGQYPDLEIVEIRTKSGTEKMLTSDEYTRFIHEEQEIKKFTPAGYVKYIGNREGVEKDSFGDGLFDMNGSVPTDTAAATAKELEGNLWWTPIISIKREDGERTGFDNREAWESLIRSKVPEIAKQYNISMENLVFYAAYHDKEKNPHAHLFFTSTDKAEGFVKGGTEAMNQKTNRLKSMFFNEIFKDDTAFLKQDKNQNRKELQQAVDKSLSRIMSREYIPSPDIITQYEAVAKMLHDSTGRKVYGYLSPEGKRQVNDLLRTILDTDPNVKSVYRETLRIQEEFLNQYIDDPKKIEQHLQEYQQQLLSPKKNGDTRLQNLIIEQVQSFCSTESKAFKQDKLSAESEDGYLEPIDIWEDEAPAGQKKEELYPSKEAKKEAIRLYKKGKELQDQGDTGLAKIMWVQSAKIGNPYAAYQVGKKYMSSDPEQRNVRLGLEFLDQAERTFREIDDKFANSMIAKIQHTYNTLSDEDLRKLDLPKEYLENKETNYADEIIALWKAKEQGDDYSRIRLRQMAFDPKIYRSVFIGTTEQEATAFYCLDTIRREPIEYYAQNTREYQIARQYLYGSEHIQQDIEQAEEKMLAEAHAGNALESYEMAVVSERKEDMESRDQYYREAYSRFLEISKKSPSPTIDYRLGIMNLYGQGVPEDMDKAIKFFTSAANEKHSMAQYRLARIHLEHEEYFDLEKGLRHLYAAADMSQKHRNEWAMYYLGKELLKGNFMAVNEQEAFQYISVAANSSKNPIMLCTLADLYESGTGIEVNHETAYGLYAQALQGLGKQAQTDLYDSHTLFQIGSMYAYGQGTEPDYDKAIEYWEKAGKLRNGKALYQLGILYLYDEERRDVKKGTGYLKQAAELENVKAIYQLGKFFLHDEEYQNIPLAIDYLTQAADLGNPQAQYRLGKFYFEDEENRNIPKGVQYLEQAIKQENHWAMYFLGKQYLYGEWVGKDEKKAFDLIQKAAQCESPVIWLTLASLHEQGIGTKQDKEKAEENYRLAYQGFLKAVGENPKDDYSLYQLGNMLMIGTGTERDKPKAVEYWEKAADLGNSQAQYQLGKFYFEEGETQDIPKGVKYLEQAVKQENHWAMYFLGKQYLYGELVGKDEKKAFDLIQKAAQCESPVIWLTLASLHEQGIGTKQDKEKAEENYRLAYQGFLKAVGENPKDDYSLYQLGAMLMNGTGTEQDKSKAAEYWEKAVDLGNSQAQYQLGKYYFMEEATRNIPKGLQYLNQAIQHENYWAMYFLGKQYLSGEMIPKDEKQGFTLIEKAAKGDDPIVRYALASLYEQGIGTKQDKEKAEKIYTGLFQKYQERTKRNPQDADSLYHLGKMYHLGQGTKQDDKQAVICWEKSAKLGNEMAMVSLGQHYFEVWHYDLSMGEHYLKMAADKGNEYAMNLLAREYAKTDDPLLLRQQIIYLDSLYEKGHTCIRYQFAKCCLKDSEYTAKGLNLMEQEVNNGNSYAMYQLGKWYLSPEHLDKEKSDYYFKLSASSGNPYAIARKNWLVRSKVIYASKHLMSKVTGMLGTMGQQQSASIDSLRSGRSRFHRRSFKYPTSNLTQTQSRYETSRTR